MAYLGANRAIPFMPRRRGMGDAVPVYPTGGTPQDVYNAVLANTGDATQAAQAAGAVGSYFAGQWNAAPWTPSTPAAAPGDSVSSLFSGNTLLYMAGALVLLAFLLPMTKR